MELLELLKAEPGSRVYGTMFQNLEFYKYVSQLDWSGRWHRSCKAIFSLESSSCKFALFCAPNLLGCNACLGCMSGCKHGCANPVNFKVAVARE